MIPDPFIGVNEELVQWVSEMDWEFTSDPFNNPDSSENFDFLKLEGMQLYCNVALNGVELGSTNNAFKDWEFGLHSSLKTKDNIFTLTFKSPLKLGG